MELNPTRRVQVPETLTRESISHLRTTLHDAWAEGSGCRVVVLHGSGETFCIGADLLHLSSGGAVAEEATAFAALLQELAEAPLPLVAEVSGRVVGGGVGLAAAADVVVASVQASFSLTEALFGALPAIITPVLLRRITPAMLTRWTLTGESWSAEEALAHGLVDACAPVDRVATETNAWVRRLRRVASDAVAPFRNYLVTNPRDPGAGVALTVERFTDGAVQARIRAFVEHGRAPWIED